MIDGFFGRIDDGAYNLFYVWFTGDVSARTGYLV